MKRLRRLSAQLGTLYRDMGETFSNYQSSVGLACPSECGACCLAPTIEASPLEMLPTALALFDEGIAEQTLESLASASSSQCIFYKKSSFDGTSGRCTTYQTRPTLCRVFGVAARKNKMGARELSLCRVIKAEHSASISALSSGDIMRAPLMSEWKAQVSTFESVLPTKDMPINDALKMALEKVLLTSVYSPDDHHPDQTIEAIS